MAGFLDFINLLKLEVDVYHNARVCGNWTINAHSVGQTCFHMATQGECVLNVPNKGQWRLKEGDLVIFPNELPHSMVSVKPLQGPQQHLPVANSQHLDGTSMLCGKVSFEHLANEHLLATLPKVLVIENTLNTPWLTQLREMILLESLSSEQSTNVIITRLCELLFAYALRHYLQTHVITNSVFALYTSEPLNKVIDSIHNEPQRAWTLAELASIACMSRTKFALLFKSVSSWTVMEYITWWRMQLAWRYLSTGLSVLVVANKVGYLSEAAFSRVFNKHFGCSAGQVRRGYGKRQ
ncbi:AraC family transcriptional regulator [Pseudoalteromonas sp. A25]|uniref:AraC family transcriptional regulator n=1 Tax=Pseudoalteromonas sp. A25 TaxID=116092 RepID=UPI001260F3DD|nr:AraC family transcriptional regulator [Pseudoalteromonas sp. A25]BBN81266.1 AraC family transcriptional regulator [Pseudoalteromonas sp. A25]